MKIKTFPGGGLKTSGNFAKKRFWFKIGLFTLLIFTLVDSPEAAPEDNTFTRQLEKLRRDPLVRELLRRGEQPGLTAEQRRVLSDSVDRLSDAEVDFYLKEFKLAQSGSVYRKRERLKVGLGLIQKPDLAEKKSPPRVAIENASEGEYMRGEQDEQGLLKLQGRIRIRLPDGMVHADTVIVDTRSKEIYAEGNLIYEGSEGRITAERIIYNQELESGIMYNAAGYQKPLYFVGRNLMSLDSRRTSLSHSRFTTCAARRPHYNFSARRIWIYDGRKIVAVGVLYYVGGVPLLPLPFLFASDWGTGIITQAGQGKRQGTFIQNTYQFSLPDAALSSWQPMYYRFKLDYYQNTGENFGMEFYKFSPHVNYMIDLNGAHYRRYEAVYDPLTPEKFRFTNEVARRIPENHYFNRSVACSYLFGKNCNLSRYEYGEDDADWYKALTFFNFKKSEAKRNHVRNVHIRYEDYSHQQYDFEFAGRYQPASTIPALYENSELGSGLIRSSTNWNLVYNERWDDLSVRVEAQRNRYWRENPSDYHASRYLPVNDVLPAMDLEKRFKLGHLPLDDAPVYWTHRIHTDVKKMYSNGKQLYAINTNRYSNDLKSYFSWYPYITYQPLIGYGAQKMIPQTEDKNLIREAKQNSYEYYYTQNRVELGPDFLNLSATHRYKKSFNEEESTKPQINGQPPENDSQLPAWAYARSTLGLANPTLSQLLLWKKVREFDDSEKVNETEVELLTRPLHGLELSISSVYDHKQYFNHVSERERWHYPVAHIDWRIDFLNFGRRKRENLLSQRRLHFLELNISNDYVYDYRLQRDHSNVFGINFRAGGFDLWLLERLRYLEMGFYWYHVYYNRKLDHMRFSMKWDIQLTRFIYLEMELESRATEIERYHPDSKDEQGRSNYVSAEKDILNSSGLMGQKRRQEAAFNIGYMQWVLLFDLHEWELRLGYELEQKTVLTTNGQLNVVNYYDNRVFISATLLRFDVAGASDRPSRFIINRRRVRSGDVGRVPVGYQWR